MHHVGGQTATRFLSAMLMIVGLAGAAVADLWGTSLDPNMTAPMGTEDQYNRVFRFDTDGTKISGDIASGSAGLSFPSGIAVSPDGTIFVSSAGIGSILVYDGQTGSPVSIGGGPAGFFTTLSSPPAAPAQLAFGPDGNLYVSEYFGTTVRVYDPATGARLDDAVTGLTSASGLAFGPDGDLYVGDGFVMSEEDSARVVHVAGGVATTFGDTGAGVLSSPTGLLFLPNGDLLVADVLGNYVARFDENGENFQPFAIIPPEIPDPLPEGVLVPSNNPSDIDFDQDGNLIVSVLGLTYPPDNRGALLRYELDGTPLAPLAENLQPTGGIAWTPSAKTLAGDYNGDETVDEMDHAKWKDDFGKWVAKGNGADGNNNGVIDAADYVTWRMAAGSGAGGNSPHTVPEPATAVFAVVALAVASMQRPRNHMVRRMA